MDQVERGSGASRGHVQVDAVDAQALVTKGQVAMVQEA
jgi:hypothetical protein